MALAHSTRSYPCEPGCALAECSSQQFSGRVAKAAHLDGSKMQHHLQRELCKILAAHLSPSEKQNDGVSASENYVLLEQLAKSLAATGSNLYHQSTIEIQNASEAIQKRIDELKRESSAAMMTSTQLYHIISQPLAERAEAGRDEEDDSVKDQLTLLQEAFSSAEENVESLHEQWQACVRTEQEAWKQLTDAPDAPEEEPGLQDLIDGIEEIVRSGEREISNIEGEYAEYIQIESLKVMQTLMEG